MQPQEKSLSLGRRARKTPELFSTAAVSYEPLHHKYRPQTFSELVGQDAIAITLGNAIRTSKIAPAYLFTGPRGTGKTSSARILAKSLNCIKNNTPTEQPCGVCVVCKAIANGSALDVIEIDAASNTGVDNIRELIERAQFAPVQCRYKVYVIDECHMLSTAAFNALLKTLEEPPDRVVFVLATTDPQRVLPTIISRCQRFDFRRIPLEAMVKHLSTIAAQENINIAPEAIRLVAQVAQGGLRDAESLLDQLSLLSGQVTVERVWDLVGSCSEPDLVELLQAIAHNHPEAVLDSARKVMDRGRESLTILQNIAGFYRDLLIAKTSPNRSDLVTVTPPTWKALCELARLWDIPTILAGQKYLKDSEVQIKNTTQPRLWLEVTLLGLLPAANTNQSVGAALTPSPSQPVQRSEPSHDRSSGMQQLPSEPITPVIPAANGISHQGIQPESADTVAPTSQPISAQTPTPEPPTAPPASQEQPTANSLAQTALQPTGTDASRDIFWQQLLDHLQPRATQSLLRQQCRLLAFDGAVARIGINSQPLLKLVQDKLPNIEAAFQQLLQQKVKVILEAGTPTPQTKTAPGKELRGRSPLPPASQPPSADSASAPQTDQVKSHQLPTSSSQAQMPSQFQAGMAEFTQPLQPPELGVAEPPTPSIDYAPTTAATAEEDDEVAIAAQRLAKAVNGELVRLSLEPAFPEAVTTKSTLPTAIPATSWEDSEDEEDIEF